MDFQKFVMQGEEDKRGDDTASAVSSPRPTPGVANHTTTNINPTTILLVFFTLILLAGAYYFYNKSVQGNTVLINNTLDIKPSLSDGLVGHWTFDGQDMDWASTTAEVRDRSGNGNHGNLMNADNKAAVQGKLGQGMKFDGVDDYVSLGNSPLFNITEEITISMWIKPKNIPLLGRLFGRFHNSELIFELNDSGKICLGIYGNPQSSHICSSSILKNNSWYHVVGTYNDALDTIDVYVNGQLSTHNLYTYQVTSAPTFPFTISNNDSYYYAGTIDDVRIYNRALSQADITALYKMGEAVKVGGTPENRGTLGDGLVGHWTFDGNDMTATTVNDRSSTHATGTLTSMDNKSSRVAGKLGQGLKFDGVDDRVTTTNNSIYNLQTELTFSAWIMPKTFGAGSKGRVIDKNNGNSYVFFIDNVNRSNGITFCTNGCGGNVGAANTIRLNTWQHVVTTMQNGAVTMYINGVVIATGTQPNPINSATALTIGWNGVDNSRIFDGTLDDVRIYNRTLTQSEITQLYKMGQPVLVNARPQASTTPPSFTCGDSITFTYNSASVTYGTLTAEDGNCWMDRNLGATQVANSSTDSASYGHLFQWGRADDGHQVTTSGTTATNADVPGHSNFITESTSPYDWRVNQDGTLWANSTSTNTPCPADWHVPTQTEWATLVTAEGITNAATAYSSSLKLSLAGYRNRVGGSLGSQGSSGYYWSSGASGSNALYLYFSSGGVDPADVNNRAHGFSVRCVQD